MPDTHTLTLIVRDKPGVLVRVAQVFSRRNCNISSIQVVPLPDQLWSEMIITACNLIRLDQIISQLEKLVDVKSISLTPTRTSINSRTVYH